MEENKYQVMALDPEKSLQLFKVASTLLESGLYKQVPNAAAAFAIVQFGAELGYGPMVSLQNIAMLQGKPCCSAQMMLAQMKRAGWNYRIIESTDTVCKLLFSCGDHQETIDYTIEEANRAGLTGKETWKKYPKDLLFSRCVSRANRRLAPETSMGMYTVEELEVDQPAIGPDKAKNVTPHEEQLALPGYWDHLGEPAREHWGVISKEMLPRMEALNGLLAKDGLHPIVPEPHFVNSCGQFLSENKIDFSQKWSHLFLAWRKSKKENEAKAKESGADPDTGEVQQGDDLPWSDDDWKELQIEITNHSKTIMDAFKAEGEKTRIDILQADARYAAEHDGPGLDLLRSDVAEYADQLIQFCRRRRLEEINNQIPPG